MRVTLKLYLFFRSNLKPLYLIFLYIFYTMYKICISWQYFILIRHKLSKFKFSNLQFISVVR